MNSDDFTPVAYYERYCENVLNQHHEIGTRGIGQLREARQ